MSRILGIDYGEKRVGLALTDKSNQMAGPLAVLNNDGFLKDKIIEIIKKHDIGKIIIGMPLNLKGHYGYQADIVTKFISDIIEPLGLPVETFDERFTSSISVELSGIAHKTARSQSKGQARKKKEKRLSGDIDKISAAILLNDYLAKNIFQK